MPVNHADSTTLGAFLGCPIIAGLTAASEQAGWFTILFVAAGLVVGSGVAYGVRKVAYLILNVGASQSNPWVGWPLLIAYCVLPVAISVGGMIVSRWGTIWLVRHLL